MYHISTDSRARRSAEAVCQALRNCLKTQSFSEITVSRIQRAAGVSRSTFYRLFDNSSDILAYLSDQVVRTAAELIEEKKVHTGREIMLIYIDLWRANLSTLSMIAQCGRMDLIYESNRKYFLPLRSQMPLPDCSDPIDSQYFWTIMTGLQASVLKVLLEEDPSVSSEEIRSRIEICLEAFHIFFTGKSRAFDESRGGDKC